MVRFGCIKLGLLLTIVAGQMLSSAGPAQACERTAPLAAAGVVASFPSPVEWCPRSRDIDEAFQESVESRLTVVDHGTLFVCEGDGRQHALEVGPGLEQIPLRRGLRNAEVAAGTGHAVRTHPCRAATGDEIWSFSVSEPFPHLWGRCSCCPTWATTHPRGSTIT
jgi:hypothetical protein